MTARRARIGELVRWWPRPAAGLPPGQRLLTEMPRFSDDPRRPPPVVGPEPALEVAVGPVVESFAVAELATDGAAIDRAADFHCVTGWSVRGLRWRGIRLLDLVERTERAAAPGGSTPAVGASRPPFAVARALDGHRAIFRTEDLLDPRTLVATELGGRPLDTRHGEPLRLVTPHLYGYKNVKHLASIELVDEPPTSSLGAKEHLRARVDAEERHATRPTWLLRLPYRLAIPITAIVAERSLAASTAGRRPAG